MGQKTNSNLLRAKIKQNHWDFKYFERSPEETTRYDFLKRQIKSFLIKFFKNNGIMLHTFKIKFTEKHLFLYISLTLTEQTKYALKKLRAEQKIKFKQRSMKSNYYLKKMEITETKRQRKLLLKKLKTRRTTAVVKKLIKKLISTHSIGSPSSTLIDPKEFKREIRLLVMTHKGQPAIQRQLPKDPGLQEFYRQLDAENLKIKLKTRKRKIKTHKRKKKVLKKLRRHTLKLLILRRKTLLKTADVLSPEGLALLENKPLNFFTAQNIVYLKRKNFLKKKGVLLLLKKKLLPITEKGLSFLKKKKDPHEKIRMRPMPDQNKRRVLSKIRKRRRHLKRRYRKKPWWKIKHNRKRQISVVRFYNNITNKLVLNQNDNQKLKNLFYLKIIEAINIFTGNKYHVSINFQLFNSKKTLGLTRTQQRILKKLTLSLRQFKRRPFFKDALNMTAVLLKTPNAADILAQFTANMLRLNKRQTFFAAFLKRLLLRVIQFQGFNIKGVRVEIKGRFNNKLRAKKRIIVAGKCPIQCLTAQINHSEATSYTRAGTFGVKTWIYERGSIL